MSELPLTHNQIIAAADRIAPFVHRTELLRSAAIDERAGQRVLMKAEHLQRSGSFKARGAHNKMLVLGDDARRTGVVTVSSGNHATALACAGRRLAIDVDVYMPHDAPDLKQRATAAYGATIHHFDRHTDNRATLLADHVEQHGSLPIEPYDDYDVMAGQGTLTVEILDQAACDGADIDTIVVPMSGGGLMAGCAVAVRALRPEIRIVGVEPAGAADTAQSFAAGARVTLARPDTIADGLAVAAPGRLTFEINRALVDEVLTVTDRQIVDASMLLFERAKQVVEPSGAAALAAVLARQVQGDNVAVVLSGGNIDLAGLSAVAASMKASER